MINANSQILQVIIVEYDRWNEVTLWSRYKKDGS